MSCRARRLRVVRGLPPRAGDLPRLFQGDRRHSDRERPAEVGTKNILQLNTTMFELYGDAGADLQEEHPGPSIRSSSGCSPAPADVSSSIAPAWRRSTRRRCRSPISCSNRSATAPWRWPEVVIPYLDSPNDPTWRSSLAAYRNRMQSALDGLDATAMRDDWRPNNRSILQNNIAFMDEA